MDVLYIIVVEKKVIPLYLNKVVCWIYECSIQNYSLKRMKFFNSSYTLI